MHHRHAVRRHRDRADVVGHQRIAALRERRGDRRFARARRAAEQDRLAVDAHRARVQHDLLALMQQNAEHGAEDEDRNVAGHRHPPPARRRSRARR